MIRTKVVYYLETVLGTGIEYRPTSGGATDLEHTFAVGGPKSWGEVLELQGNEGFVLVESWRYGTIEDRQANLLRLTFQSSMPQEEDA